MSYLKNIGTEWQKMRTIQRIAVLLLICITIAHFVGLAHTPQGFAVDEASLAATMIDVRQTGRDMSGEWLPLFSKTGNAGYTTPLYVYGGAAWSAVFGNSEYAFRAYALFLTVLAVALLMVGCGLWYGVRGAIAIGFVATLIPWSWHQGQLNWDPAMVPLWISLGFVSWSYLVRVRWSRIAWALVLASMVALVYTYPPARLSGIPIVIFYVVTLAMRYRTVWRLMAATILMAGMLLVPLLLFMITPEAQLRSQMLSVWGYGARNWAGVNNWTDSLGLVLSHMRQFLHYDFLFFVGDPSLRHNYPTGLLGVFSFGIVVAAGAAVVRYFLAAKETQLAEKLRENHLLIVLCVVGALSGFMGAALTWESQPHSLRAVVAWPFLAILLTMGILFVQKTSTTIFVPLVIFATLSAATFLLQYYGTYNEKAALWYEVPVRQALIEAAQDNRQPPFQYEPTAFRYYQQRYSVVR